MDPVIVDVAEQKRLNNARVVAKLIQLFGLLDPQKVLEVGKSGAFIRGKSEGEAKK